MKITLICLILTLGVAMSLSYDEERDEMMMERWMRGIQMDPKRGKHTAEVVLSHLCHTACKICQTCREHKHLDKCMVINVGPTCQKCKRCKTKGRKAAKKVGPKVRKLTCSIACSTCYKSITEKKKNTKLCNHCKACKKGLKA